jgi:energy-converting hydrogenase B subunit D
VLTRQPRRQVVVSGAFGLALTLLFFTFQAPDVALSQLVVGTVALPAMIVLALGKLALREGREREGDD